MPVDILVPRKEVFQVSLYSESCNCEWNV